jgi:hypothetical protein
MEERAATNNHGVFYDEQVAALALFVGTALRRAIGRRKPIASQIDADGNKGVSSTAHPCTTPFQSRPSPCSPRWGVIGVDLWHYGAGDIEKAISSSRPYADRR